MPRTAAESQLRAMLAAVRHDASYQTGMWMDESLGIYMGWTALTDSFSEGMPLLNERGDIALVFSGEDACETETASTLRARGHDAGGKRCAYLVHLYEEDPLFPSAVNGRFHGVVA